MSGCIALSQVLVRLRSATPPPDLQWWVDPCSQDARITRRGWGSSWVVCEMVGRALMMRGSQRWNGESSTSCEEPFGGFAGCSAGGAPGDGVTQVGPGRAAARRHRQLRLQAHRTGKLRRGWCRGIAAASGGASSRAALRFSASMLAHGGDVKAALAPLLGRASPSFHPGAAKPGGVLLR